MDGFLLDWRCAIRGLARHPAVVIPVMLCLGLGIGAAGSLSILLDRLLLRSPAHVQEAEELVSPSVQFEFPGAGLMTSGSFSYTTYRDLQGRVEALHGLTAFHRLETSLGRGSNAEPVEVLLVSDGYFDLLGTRPILGRFDIGQEADGETVVLSHGFWRRRYGGDSAVLGSLVRIGARDYAVSGIAPPSFQGIEIEPVDLWLPLAAGDDLIATGWRESAGTKVLDLVARLPASIDPGGAAEEAGALFRGLNDGHPLFGQAEILLAPVLPLRGFGHRDTQVTLWLTALVAVLLIIACLSVSFVLLVRCLRRQRDIGIRACLGASRFAALRQTIFEWLSVVAASLLVACGLAWLGTVPLSKLLLASPIGWEPGLSLRSAGTIAMVGLVAAVLTGALPLAYGLKIASSSRWRNAADGHLAGGHLRDFLLASQVAATVVLLMCGALFLQSFRDASAVDLGFDVDETLVATTDLQQAGFPYHRSEDFQQRALERVRSMPHVRSASLGAAVPLDSVFGTQLQLPGREELPQLPGGGPYIDAVDDRYFFTLGTKLQYGRTFARSGIEEAVAILNESTARAFWPDGEPLGRCIALPETDDGGCTRVIGIVEDVHRQGLGDQPAVQVYVPLDRRPEWMRSLSLFVRPEKDGLDLAASIRSELQSLDPAVPWVSVQRLRELMEPEIRPWRAGAVTFSILGLLSFVVALIGLVATVLTIVDQRRGELGIRLALGADTPRLVRSVCARGLVVAVAGCALGVAASHVLSARLGPLLFQTDSLDPRTLLALPITVLLAVGLAVFIPAHQVTSINPSDVLKEGAAS